MYSQKSFWEKFLKYSVASVVFVIGFIILFYNSMFKLTETPPTWMDEGIIIETARNFASSGIAGIRVDPETIVSGGYVTTSYPVTYPISILFDKYGVSIFNARIVMVVYILFTVIFCMFLSVKIGRKSKIIYILSFFSIITFAPLYGHGKNVLGEVPALFYLYASMLFLFFLNESIFRTDIRFRQKIFYLFMSSVLLGLSFVTKPIYILTLPSVFIGLFIYLFVRYKNSSMFEVRFLSLKKTIWYYVLFAAFGFILPILVWFFNQFNGDNLSDILSLYINPHSTDLYTSILTNTQRFFSEFQPIYTLFLFLIWSLVLFIKYRKKENVYIAEYSLWVFSLLVLVAYLRTIGFYRYFFPAEVFPLVLLPSNLIYIQETFFKKNYYKYLIYIFICILIGFQTYGLYRSSWVASYRDSTKSSKLEQALKDLSSNQEVFLYQVPEVATFIKSENYSEYLEITPTIKVGQDSIKRIKDGLPYLIITKDDENLVKYIDNISNGKYKIKYQVDRYTFLTKK